MRYGRAHECDFEHAGFADVADELAAAVREARVFFPAQRSADAPARTTAHSNRRGYASSENGARKIHAKVYTIAPE